MHGRHSEEWKHAGRAACFQYIKKHNKKPTTIIVHIIMPRCTCAKGIYSIVSLCICACVYLCICMSVLDFSKITKIKALANAVHCRHNATIIKHNYSLRFLNKGFVHYFMAWFDHHECYCGTFQTCLQEIPLQLQHETWINATSKAAVSGTTQ